MKYRVKEAEEPAADSEKSDTHVMEVAMSRIEQL
jgi:hypothetical protein